MKKKILFMMLLFISIVSYSAVKEVVLPEKGSELNIGESKIVAYYNEYWVPITNKNDAIYYKKFTRVDEMNFKMEDFFIDGTPYSFDMGFEAIAKKIASIKNLSYTEDVQESILFTSSELEDRIKNIVNLDASTLPIEKRLEAQERLRKLEDEGVEFYAGETGEIVVVIPKSASLDRINVLVEEIENIIS